MRQVSSVLSLFMLFPVAFATGLCARQAAALVTTYCGSQTCFEVRPWLWFCGGIK